MNYRKPLLMLSFYAGLLLGAGAVLGLMSNDMHLLTLNGGQIHLWQMLLGVLLVLGVIIGSGTLLLAKGIFLLWYGKDARREDGK